MQPRNRNTSLLFGVILFVIVWLAAYILYNNKITEPAVDLNTVTHFICERLGEHSEDWTNKHYDIVKAEYLGASEWLITNHDKRQTYYRQRQGEGCYVQTLPLPAK